MANVHLTETKIDRDKLFERVVEQINESMKDTVHVVEGAPQASLLQSDGTYKTKPVFGDQELFFKDVRVGKSGKIIFSFTPVDDMPWKQCEWDAVKLDQAVPLFGGVFAEKLNLEGEHLPTLVTDFIEKTEQMIISEAEAEKRNAAEAYANNEKFGRF
ncbi:hypothetical protein [Galbibacter sp. BG1]